MGIDVYLRWDGMTKEEEEAQYCGFQVDQGRVGYLREAYHGGPYATHVLLPEGFEAEGEVSIPGKVLLERLPEAISAAIKRAREVYGEEVGEDSPVVRSLKDFVALALKLEAEGRNPTIYVSY